jgi:protein-S-isoprenylcysteine O-methyltransferase Ste14
VSVVEAKPRFMPPVYFLVSLIVMVLLSFVPVGSGVIPNTFKYAGAALILLGVGVAIVAARSFDKAGTTIRPFDTSSALVTHGPFRFTRNPMYLSMAVALLGTGIALGDVLPFVVIPAFVSILQLRFIRHEEAMMEAEFGDAYRAYKERVRRWL